jgi:hypothetical protein
MFQPKVEEQMKTLASGLAALMLAVTLAIPAPASAQSFSFGFSVGPRVSYCDMYPWDCRPRWWGHRPRARINIDLGPLRFSLRARTHVARCEARFRSYNRYTDMYLGFDGDWHYCRL